MSGQREGQKLFPFWASVLTLCGVIILCSLGVWQLQRLAWKTDLIAEMERRANQEFRILEPEDLADENFYRIIGVRGEFADLSGVQIIPRPRKNKDGTMTQGMHVFVPFLLQGVGAVMVNLGWAPQDFDLHNLSLREGEILLKGMIRPYPAGNLFTPQNNISADQWYLPRAQDFKVRYEADIVPVIIQAVDLSGDAIGVYPEPLSQDIELKNNHAQYAAFWFSMAAAFIAVFLLRFKPFTKV